LTLASLYAETSPETAARLAAYLPEALVGSAMAQVGMAAAKGEDPPPSALARLRALARLAPLSPEPYLVNGAIALRSGDFERAEKLLLQARQLAPRSAAARILLADLWVAQGRIRDGFGELAALSRLVPNHKIMQGYTCNNDFGLLVRCVWRDLLQHAPLYFQNSKCPLNNISKARVRIIEDFHFTLWLRPVPELLQMVLVAFVRS
jgi:tetratricopeptide (TPR) repeat protein